MTANLVKRNGFWVRADNVEQDLTVVRDVYEQDAYKTALLDARAFDDVVDVGAHIGAFARLWHEKNPKARILCVEANPDNLEALRANVGDFARVIHAACTYEAGPLGLLNSVYPGCESTGGSIVVPLADLDAADGQPGYTRYDRDRREMPKTDLEALMGLLGSDHIDLLKLDCEGSEFSILGNCLWPDRVRFIVGEYHGRARWDAFRAAHYPHWDYGHMYENGDLGLFHLANRPWPREKLTPELHALRLAIVAAMMPGDRADCAIGFPWYERLYLWAKEAAQAGARTAVETGMRAGYSALTLFRAGLSHVTSLDNLSDPQSQDRKAHAFRILPPERHAFIECDSTLPGILFDHASLAVIDGDHSERGALADIAKAAACGASVVIVDDVAPGNPVEKAVARFCQDDKAWAREDARLAVNRWAVRLRRLDPAISIAIPAGIGDILWVLAKAGSVCKAAGVRWADFVVCQEEGHRRADFLERSPLARSVRYAPWRIDKGISPSGTYDYDPSGPGWHGYDWMMQANGHLEEGKRLEDWLPGHAIDWDVARKLRVTDEEEGYALDFAAKHRRFVLMYAGPEEGNTARGHNRGGIWSPKDWGTLARAFLDHGVLPVFVGAEWDKSYFRRSIARALVDAGASASLDIVGWTSIGQFMALCREAHSFVGYQSGLGVYAAWTGCRAAMWWRAHGDSLHPDRHATFSEAMASAWVPKDVLADSLYLPLVYGRELPEDVMRRMENSGWFGTRKAEAA